MTLKSITLHRPATDNLGNFQDAGTDLIVGDEAKAGVIDADRARELVTGHGAAGHYETASKTKPPARNKRPAKPLAKAPPAADAQPPVPEPDKPADPAPEHD